MSSFAYPTRAVPVLRSGGVLKCQGPSALNAPPRVETRQCVCRLPGHLKVDVDAPRIELQVKRFFFLAAPKYFGSFVFSVYYIHPWQGL